MCLIHSEGSVMKLLKVFRLKFQRLCSLQMLAGLEIVWKISVVSERITVTKPRSSHEQKL